jgi:uncharacterized protein (DUF58 family)
MIVPAPRLIALVAFGGGGAALIAAISTTFTTASLAVIALIGIIAVIDAMTGLRAVGGISVAAPALIRTVRDRLTHLPFSVINNGPETRGLQAAFEFPESFRMNERVIKSGSLLGTAQRFDLNADFESARRGEFLISRCWVRTESRLGLWSTQKPASVGLTVRVYPNLRSDETAAQFLRRGTIGSHAVRVAGKGREFEKLREYVHGDSYEEVDWKATARRGKPVVRVFQAERTQEVYVAIDASRLGARPVGSQTTLEHYVTSALVMGLASEVQGDRFGLITFSDRLHTFVRARAGRQHFTVCRNAIYRLQPRIVEPDFGELFAFLETRLTKRALIVILTALDDPLIGETFARHVEIASRRHLVIAAMVRPQGANPLFEDPAHDTDEIYDRLAGHLRWRKLVELTKECQRKGVRLHLLAPERISGQLTLLYLDVKRRQRL